MSGAGLRFGVLGPLAVLRDGELVALTGTLRRALLALLVLHAREPAGCLPGGRVGGNGLLPPQC